jgi:hypothetical protein
LQDDVKNGPAAYHLLKIHRVLPVQMIAKGLKFTRLPHSG